MDDDTRLAFDEVLRIARVHSRRLAALESKLQALTMMVGCVTAEVALATPNADDKLDDMAVELHGLIDGLTRVAPQDGEVWRQMSPMVEIVLKAAEGVLRPGDLVSAASLR